MADSIIRVFNESDQIVRVGNDGRYTLSTITRTSELINDGSEVVDGENPFAYNSQITALNDKLEADVERLDDAIKAETERATSSELTLNNSISVLAQDLETESNRAQEAEISLGERLTSEVEALTIQLNSKVPLNLSTIADIQPSNISLTDNYLYVNNINNYSENKISLNTLKEVIGAKSQLTTAYVDTESDTVVDFEHQLDYKFIKLD